MIKLYISNVALSREIHSDLQENRCNRASFATKSLGTSEVKTDDRKPLTVEVVWFPSEKYFSEMD